MESTNLLFCFTTAYLFFLLGPKYYKARESLSRIGNIISEPPRYKTALDLAWHCHSSAATMPNRTQLAPQIPALDCRHPLH